MIDPKLPRERLHKVLARVGLGSRRQLEQWIRDGRVTVNGVVAGVGEVVDATAAISLDGRAIDHKICSAAHRSLLYYKPEGVICTRHDPQGRPTVFDHLPFLRGSRWIAIGRLDINSSGLLLFTTNGELANRWMHPRHHLEREYRVRVLGHVTEKKLQLLRQGVLLEDGWACFKRVEFLNGSGANQWYRVVLHEGRKREVRRLWESQACQVSRLIRVRFAHIVLPVTLKPGEFVEITCSCKIGMSCIVQSRDVRVTP